jgi:serine O-acetyltransferase
MASDLRLKEELPALTEEIVDTYATVPTINHLGHCPLPKHEEVIAAVQDLKDILYPGYRRREGLHIGNVTYHVGDLIDGLHDKLTTQIARALLHDARVSRGIDPCQDKEDYAARGQRIAIAFLNRLPDLRRLLAMDVQAAYDGDPACKGLDEVILCYPGLEAVTVYRLAHELHRMDVPFIPRMMTEWAHKETGIDIHPGARIGHHFFIDHGTGVVVGETTEIGNYVKLYQGVTLGALSFPTDADGNLIRHMKRHPTIEDRVVIYANATILGGNTTIGHDAVIGSSVWLTQSVAPHTTVTIEKPGLQIRAEPPDTSAALEPHGFQV